MRVQIDKMSNVSVDTVTNLINGVTGNEYYIKLSKNKPGVKCNSDVWNYFGEMFENDRVVDKFHFYCVGKQ